MASKTRSIARNKALQKNDKKRKPRPKKGART